MNSKKLLPILLGLAVLTIFGVACAAPTAVSVPVPTAASAASAPTTAPASTDNVQLDVWVRFPEVQKLLQELGDKYTETHPNVKIVVSLFAQRALDDKIAVALPAKQGPDIVENDAITMAPYETQGLLSYVPDDLAAYAKEHLLPRAVDNATNEQGKMFNIPLMVGIQGIYVNKDYLEEAGLSGCPATVDELLQWAKKLTKYDDKGAVTRSGFSFRLSGGGYGTAEKFWALAMVPYGTAPWKQVGDKWTNGYDNDGGVSALMMYVDGMNKLKVDSPDIKHDSEGFGLGMSSMFQRESSVIAYLAENAPNINYDTCLMPKGPADWGTAGSAGGLSVIQTSKNQAVAYDWLKFLLSDENQYRLLDQTGWLPVNKDADYSAIYKKIPQYQGFLKALNTPGYNVYFYPKLPVAVDIEGKMADALVPAFVDPSYVDNPTAAKELIHKMAQTTDQILSDADLLAE